MTETASIDLRRRLGRLYERGIRGCDTCAKRYGPCLHEQPALVGPGGCEHEPDMARIEQIEENLRKEA